MHPVVIPLSRLRFSFLWTAPLPLPLLFVVSVSADIVARAAGEAAAPYLGPKRAEAFRSDTIVRFSLSFFVFTSRLML